MKQKNLHIQLHKLILLLVCLTMFTCIMTSCDKNSSENNRTKLTVGFDAEFPPYGYKDDNGEYVGFDLDLAEEVCKRNSWELVKQPIDWDSKDMELSSGSIDCIWNGFTINGLEKKYTWSTAYVQNSQVIVVKSDSNINKLSDLSGKIVVVQADSSALAAFTGEDATEENKSLCKSFSTLQQVSDYNNAFMNLEAGSVDAICIDIGVASYQVEKRGNSFRMLDEIVSKEQYGIGFKLGNTSLRDSVQASLNEMLEDGTFAKIAEKWELTASVCLGEEGTDFAYLQDAPKSSDSSFLEKSVNIVKQLSTGMLSTLLIFVLTLLFAMPLGLLVCMVRMSKSTILQWIARIYISIMRGTPLMLQLLVVFFCPYYVFGISVSSQYRFLAVIIGFSLNYAAYFAEIYRSGIESIQTGQYEAASVLGYSRFQTFWKIIFPQMVKRVLPPVTNEVITLVKDTSLAFALAYTEMFTMAKQVAASDANIMPLFIAGLFYYIFNFAVALIMETFEKKMQYYN